MNQRSNSTDDRFMNSLLVILLILMLAGGGVSYLYQLRQQQVAALQADLEAERAAQQAKVQQEALDALERAEQIEASTEGNSPTEPSGE